MELSEIATELDAIIQGAYTTQGGGSRGAEFKSVHLEPRRAVTNRSDMDEAFPIQGIDDGHHLVFVVTPPLPAGLSVNSAEITHHGLVMHFSNANPEQRIVPPEGEYKLLLLRK